jgi:CheY-like chemotaxis protein
MAKLSHLLLFDTDPSGLETLTYAFEKDGIAVEPVRDAAKARGRLASTTAPILLVALRDPELVGLDLIRAASTNPASRNMACLTLGPAGSRNAALQAGAFGHLASPLFVRDVLDSCKLVAAAIIPGSRPAPETEVSISLAEVGGVYYLIRALAAAARSAAVELQRGTRRGELRFLDGNLSSAQLGGLSGLPALHHLLLWEEADLRLKFRNVVRRGGQLSLKNDEVIEQCDRFLRDFAHEVREMGTARTVYRPRDQTVQPTSALPSEVVPLLRLFDGTRDLGQVLDESPFRTFDTLRIARQFMNAGAIVTDPPFIPEPSEAAVGGPAALDGWFARRAPGSAPAAAAKVPMVAPLPERRDADEGVPTSMRTPAPFVSVANRNATGRAAAIPLTNPKDRKPRTMVQGEPSIIQNPISGSLHNAGATSLEASLQVTPPPTPAASGPTAVGAASAERPTKRAASVATGEIQVAPLTAKKHERTPKPSAPTVLVEIDSPSTLPPVVAVPPSDRATPTRLELPGPVTPLPALRATPVQGSPIPPAASPIRTASPVRRAAPVRTAPPIARAAVPERTPVVAMRAAPVTTSASPAPDEKTPPPVSVAPAAPVAIAKGGWTSAPPPAALVTQSAPAEPPPMTATPAASTGIKKPGVPSNHRTRTPSNGFSAVEADFFNREADLYKGDSPETFDDLDAGNAGGSPPLVESGRRRPARKG